MWNFQSNLTKGELDPQLAGRIELQAYYNGVETGTNVLCIPQGGLKKRPGMEYRGTALDNGRLETFAFAEDTQYLLVFTDSKMQVYKDGDLVTNINGSGVDYLTTPYTLAQVQDFDYIQSLNTIIITHEDVQPRKIVRGSTDADWTLSTITLENIPQYDYNDSSSPTPTSQIQRINLGAGTPTIGDRFKISLEGILSDEITYAGNTGADQQDSTAENIRIALQDHPVTANSGVSVTYVSAQLWDITLADDSAGDYKLMTGTATYDSVGGGAFKITFTITQAGVSRKEDVWSSTRGWARTCTFHEGRLYFGGSKSLPNSIWGSNVDDFFNFDLGRSLDDEGIFLTLDTDQLNQIQAIYSNRSLQVFTTGAEFYVRSSPITPTDAAVVPQTNFGSKRVRPVTLNGITYYIQETGNALNSFVFLDDIQSNTTDPVSILSAHLINTPTKLAIKRGSDSSDVNYIYLVGNDGNMTVYNTVPSQAVDGFTSWQTDGDIKSISIVDDTVYFLVARDNGGTYYTIERENNDMNTDAGLRETVNSDTLTGLSHLDGETITVKADGAVQDDETVSSGQITINATAVIIEAGILYTPTVTTMPLNMNLKTGPIAAKKKRIQRAAIQLYNSNGVIVNGERIPDKTIAVNQFDAPIPQSGLVRKRLGGWSLEANLTITQTTPYDMQILSLGMEVAI